MTHRPPHSKLAVLTVAALLNACAAPGPAPLVTGSASSGSASSGLAPAAPPDLLACALPSNCVSSRGDGGLSPLAYRGTPAQATARLQAALATFPDANVVRSDALAMVAIFTTPIGFRDQVDFVIDPDKQRIDYRSRSLFGLYDFGKNRSRMQAFKARFEQQQALP